MIHQEFSSSGSRETVAPSATSGAGRSLGEGYFFSLNRYVFRAGRP
jgi:hypothetical protein